MQDTDYFKGKNITVVGLARSGLACCNLLFACGARLNVTDSRDDATTRENLGKLKSSSIKVELGKHTKDFIEGRDLIVVSPGVPGDSKAVTLAEELNIPVVSEIEVAFRLCSADIIAVTGSNGKTTVTTLISRILEESAKPVFICGNIGNPFSSQVEKMKKEDYVSLEVSSFQLERIDKFKPKISVFLNFSENHLDRYKSIQEYFEAKKRIFMNQDKSDFLVLNQDEPLLRDLSKQTDAKTVFFSQSKELNPNQAAALAVASILGVNRKTAMRVFDNFKGIEHRLEYVKQIGGVKFINDSKSTTVESTIWALKNLNNPVIWIAGGKHKGLDYKAILDLAREKVKEIILIGEAARIIDEAFREALPIEHADSLEDAVDIAYQRASPGDCVLLSPMCASFDMFLNYEQRGERFKEAVSGLGL